MLLDRRPVLLLLLLLRSLLLVLRPLVLLLRSLLLRPLLLLLWPLLLVRRLLLLLLLLPLPVVVWQSSISTGSIVFALSRSILRRCSNLVVLALQLEPRRH